MTTQNEIDGHSLKKYENDNLWRCKCKMSAQRFYHQCRQGVGRPVQIRLRNGQIHHGIIERVSPNRVYLRPLNRRRPNFGGYGYAWGGWGYGGWGFGWGIALGAIAALAFIPFFF